MTQNQTFEKTIDVLMAFHSLVEEGTYTEKQLEEMSLEDLFVNWFNLVLQPYIEEQEAVS